MKLLIITSITAFEKDIRLMFQKANVKTYSFKEVTGFRDISEEAMESNWFASEINETASLLFYAIIKKESANLIFDLIHEFNENQASESHIHTAILNVEKSNHPKLHIV